MAKGNGKTPLAAGIGLYGLVADGEAGAQVYAAAVTREQAGLLFADAAAMVRRSEPLRRRLERGVGNLAHPASGSFFRPVSSEGRSLDAKRVHMALIDELHEHRDAVVVDKMRAGTKGRRQALVVEITNAGHDRTSVCWEHHEYSRHILEGVIANESWFAYVCGLDEGDDWTDEAVWPKANPLLDVSVTRKYLREQVTEALGLPLRTNLVKRLNLCVWTEAETRWLDVEGFDAGTGPSLALPAGTEAWAGLDLAATTDLTALTIVAPRASCSVAGHAGKCFDVRARFWLPEEGMRRRVSRDHVPYDVWAEQGWIDLTPGTLTDYDQVRSDLHDEAGHLTLRAIGYDSWNATQLVTQLRGDGLELVAVGQGYWSMSSPAKLLEGQLAARLVHHDGNPVLRWMVANAVAEMDPAGNLKPSKPRSSERIDGVSAWCDALFVWARSEPVEEEGSVYDQPGGARRILI
jgi:phage terminase large subunit-like protein